MNKTAQKNVSLGQYSSWGHRTNSAPLNLRGCWAHPKAADGLLEAAHASALLNDSSRLSRQHLCSPWTLEPTQPIPTIPNR